MVPIARRKSDLEFQEQCALFVWARNPLVLNSMPALALLEGSMNGVALTKAQAGKAKAAGMLTGSLDVRLPVARGGYLGFSFELKIGKNTLTTDQKRISALLRDEGWLVGCYWDWYHAREDIINYLANSRTLEKTPAG